MAKRLGDTTVRMLGYNGSIPGATLKVRQDSEVIVHVANEGDLDTTCTGTGCAWRTSTTASRTKLRLRSRSGHLTYRIRFPDPGLCWYDAHIREDYTQEMGLYGNVLVVPAPTRITGRRPTAMSC